MCNEDIVEQIMSKTVRTIDSAEDLGAAVRIMTRYGIGSVVVTTNEKPVGIITERDAIKRVSKRGASVLKQTVSSLMSKPLITTMPETEIWKAFTIMLRNKIRRLPVTKGQKWWESSQKGTC